MSRRIILAHSANWGELTGFAFQEMEQAKQVDYSWIYLTRNYLRADYLKKKFANFSSGDVHIIPPIYSWNRFIGKIYERLPISQRLLNFTDQLFFIHHILHNINGHLNYFSITTKPFSLQIAKSIQSIINVHLMQHPTESPKPLNSEEDPYQKEMLLILREYQKCKAEVFLDESDLLRSFIESSETKSFNKLFPGINKIYWEIDTPLYPVHFKVIEKLKELELDLHLFLFYDDHDDFFQNMHGTYIRLKRMADVEKSLDDPMNLTQSLYRLNQQKLQLNKQLELTKYIDRAQEVDEVAKRIKKELIEQPGNANQIAVTAPDISKYIPLLINAFTKYGIPFTVLRPAKILDLLPIQHIQLWLEILASNGELSVLKKILKSPFFNYHDNLKGIDFEEILNRLRVLFDLRVIIEQLQKSIAYEGSKNQKWGAEIEHKKILLGVLKNVETDIAPLTTSFTAEDFFNFFTSQFERHEIVSRILKWKESLPEHNAADILGAVRAFFSGLDSWRSTVKKMDNSTKFTCSEALDLYGLITNNTIYNSYAPREYGIRVVPIQTVDTMDIEELYLLGCSDGDFPGKDNQPFYDQLEGLSQLLPDNQVLDDRRLFLKLLHLPKEEIHISYPEREGEALNVASNLILELERTSHHKISNPESIIIFSKSEILSKIVDDVRLTNKLATSVIKNPDVNHFKRQVNITQLRNRLDQPYGIYEGDISCVKVASEYLTHLVATREFSVSGLELYAQKPIQYFFRRILKLKEPQGFEEWLTPSEKGKMVHRVLHRYYSEFSEPDRTLENLCQLAEEEIEKLPFLPSILWDFQKEAFLGGENRGGLFPFFFRYEKRQLESTPLKPQYFEVPFGHLGRKIESEFSGGFVQPFEIGLNRTKVRLRGIVDRIDLFDNGGIIVVDYKTGQYPSVNDIFDGKSLQLPLYLLAVTHLLQTKYPDVYPFGACYYKIKDDKEKDIQKEIIFTKRVGLENSLNAKIVFPTKNLGGKEEEFTLLDFLNRGVGFAIQYAQGIGDGKFTHHPDIRDCVMGSENACPFEPLCRANPKKIKRFEN